MTDQRNRSRVPRYDKDGKLIVRRVGRPTLAEAKERENLPIIHVIPENRRQMPETRPDSEGWYHLALCECDICARPNMPKKKNEMWKYANYYGYFPFKSEQAVLSELGLQPVPPPDVGGEARSTEDPAP